MKLFLKNCFLALLCLYRSHQTTPFRGQVAKTSIEQGVKAIAYIGSRYPCLLAKLLKLSRIMIKIKQISQSPFPPSHSSHRQVTKSHSLITPSWFYSSRFSGQDFGSWFFLNSLLSHLASHISDLKSHIPSLSSHIYHMKLFSKICFPALLCLIGSHTYCQDLPTYLYGEFQSSHKMDSVQVHFWKEYVGNSKGFPKESEWIQLESANIFHGTPPGTEMLQFTRNLTAPAYISIQIKGAILLDRFVLMPGDSIGISMDRDKGATYFIGPQAASFEVQYMVQRLIEQENRKGPMNFITPSREELLKDDNWKSAQEKAVGRSPFRNLQIIETQDSPENLEQKLKKEYTSHPAFSLLEEYRSRIPEELYRRLKADLTGYFLHEKFHAFKMALIYLPKGPDTDGIFDRRLKDIPWNIVPLEDQLGSAWYQDYLLERSVAQSAVSGNPVDEIIRTFIQDPLKERLLVQYLQENYRNVKDLASQIKTLESDSENPLHLEVLNHLAQVNAIGQPLKELSLTGTDGNIADLSEFRGKALLLDFWFTGCLPCAMLYENTISHLKKEWKDRDDIVIMSINTDTKPETWIKSISKGKYTSKDGHNYYISNRSSNPFLNHYRISSYPTLMVVDKNGNLYSYSGTPRDRESLQKLVLEAAGTMDQNFNP